MKTRERELQHQIQLTKDNIDYFSTIEQQLHHISVHDIDEIRDELAEQGFMKQRKIKLRKRKRRFNYNIMYQLMATIYMLARITSKMII